MDARPPTERRDSPRLESMLVALRAGGLKLTPQRLAILRELADDPTHPTATELFSRLRTELPSMSFATVYNTLSALTEQGLCVARALEPGAVRFDPNVEPHDHAVCDSCGLVVDIAGRVRGGSPRTAEPVAGFAVRSVERVYRGWCADCSSRLERPTGAKQATGE